MRENGTSPEMQELAEQVGEFIHYWGFKRVHGRIWAHLFLSARPLDAADLVRQMKISKALISISLRELMEFDVVQEIGKSARGTHLYRVNPDILSVILNVLRQREKRMLSRIAAAQESLDRLDVEEKNKDEISQERIAQLSSLIGNASGGLENLIALRSVDFEPWSKLFTVPDMQSPGNPPADTMSGGSQSSGGGKAAGNLASGAAGLMQSVGRTIMQHSPKKEDLIPILIGRPLFKPS